MLKFSFERDGGPISRKRSLIHCCLAGLSLEVNKFYRTRNDPFTPLEVMTQFESTHYSCKH